MVTFSNLILEVWFVGEQFRPVEATDGKGLRNRRLSGESVVDSPAFEEDCRIGCNLESGQRYISTTLAGREEAAYPDFSELFDGLEDSNLVRRIRHFGRYGR